jgi:mycothiol synthase
MTDEAVPTGFHARRPVQNDAETVFALIQACAAGEYGTPDSTLDEVRHGWMRPGFDLGADAWVVLAADGEIVGYAETWNIEPIHIHSRGFVHPLARGRGIGSFLLAHVDARAREMAEGAPQGVRVTLQQWSTAVNDSALALLRSHGFVPVRRMRRMEITISEPPARPEWPHGITVRKFVPGLDDRATHAAFDEAFRDHWGYLPLPFEQWAHWTVENEAFDPTLCFLACDGDEVAGLAQCEVFGDIGWVNDLGVRRPWRECGIGLALLLHAFGVFYGRGLTTIGLGVDSQNLTGATRLYERAGMHIAREHEVYEKELRAGVERGTLVIA